MDKDKILISFYDKKSNRTIKFIYHDLFDGLLKDYINSPAYEVEYIKQDKEISNE